MQAERLSIPDVWLLRPAVHADDRGSFLETYNAATFARLVGTAPVFVQENVSVSRRNVLRGIHYQVDPHAQGKLVRVSRGGAYDVFVDLRRSSPTFGHWGATTLTGTGREEVWIPEGFGHAFLSLEDDTEVSYLVNRPYTPGAERSIRWDDPALAIAWPAGIEPVVSAKDAVGAFLRDAEVFSA